MGGDIFEKGDFIPDEDRLQTPKSAELVPNFELKTPKFSRKFVIAFFEMEKSRYKDSTTKSLIEQNLKRLMTYFDSVDENSAVSVEKQVVENVNQKLNDPNITSDEREKLLGDKNRLMLAASTVKYSSEPMTGLYNRGGLVEALKMIVEHPQIVYKNFEDKNQNESGKSGEEEVEIKKFEDVSKLRFPILMVDIDNLKQVNDDPNGGHAAGDALILETAEVLQTSVREGDVVARYGGDEFVLVLPKMDIEDQQDEAIQQDVEGNQSDQDSEDVHLINENISLRILEKVGEGSNISLTRGGDTSVTYDDIKAVVESDDPQSALTNLLSNADKALYEAKIAGKNQMKVARNK